MNSSLKLRGQKSQHLRLKNDFSLVLKVSIRLIIMAVLGFSLNCYSSEVASKKQANKNNLKINQQKQITTKITSESIHVKRNNGIIELRRNVIIEQDDTSLLSDSVDVYYKESDNPNNVNGKSNQSGLVEKIEAKTNVKIFNQDFVVNGDRGWYEPNKRIFIVEGNVLLNRGTSTAKGERFVYDLNKKSGKLTGKQKIANPTEDSRTIVIINDEELKEQKKNNH